MVRDPGGGPEWFLSRATCEALAAAYPEAFAGRPQPGDIAWLGGLVVHGPATGSDLVWLPRCGELVNGAQKVRAARPPLDDYGHPDLFPPTPHLELVWDGKTWRVDENQNADPPRSVAGGWGIHTEAETLEDALAAYLLAAADRKAAK